MTSYLLTYRMTAHELAMTMIRDVLKQTGITATAGIGTNLYLCKIAMDIVAKHLPADKDGVRIAELDEMEYRRQLWDYKPITKFWRVGKGIAERLAPYGIDTMGKIARCSLENEDLLYRLFGVNAELLIDHAWGWEPKDGVRIAELDEIEYRRRLWDYKPITKFWRVGKGIAERLAPYGIDTMGKIARCSVENEDLLYRVFGVNAELVIYHAWGWEPCTMQAVKAY